MRRSGKVALSIFSQREREKYFCVCACVRERGREQPHDKKWGFGVAKEKEVICSKLKEIERETGKLIVQFS